ncbi:MAG: hypothetical protein ABIR70_00175 [Bryobacteraceae bacterium]
MPDGKYAFHRLDVFGQGVATFVKLLPFPADDGIDRRTFIPRIVTIDSDDVPVGTSRVRVKFGYDEHFRCNDNTDYACYAVQSTISNAAPFLWTPELSSLDGVPCTMGCSVMIPTIEGRVLRSQVIYLNSLGGITGAAPVSFEVGTLPPPGSRVSAGTVSGATKF